MESVIVLAHPGAPGTPGTGRAAEWAAHEARLRGLPLRVRDEPAPDAAVTVGGPHAVPLAATAPGPVVLIPDVPAATPLRTDVVLGVDARAPSDTALRFAFDSARLRGTRLRAVHAWTLPPEAARMPFGVPEEDRATWEDHEVQLLSDALRPWRAAYPDVPVLADVLLFTQADALLHHRAHAALIVVAGPPGQAVRALLWEAGCPVAVVPRHSG
ncbi:universal stress protein [Streptomyces roseirectus]|uniref:Universal stress protein n=1 Tax=Streptomyces roseirectus TaxID=2768066 RepID=A0A7H0I680_9ACTN|nr:universal stress protein [Streptomyces roseirectus]QNP68296.1 universal stress protein [Streptomyces roseirectus]